MSTTRLLVLGVTRIFAPVHGYSVRRELLSWQADQWANVQPGSIYNALRRLTKEGYLAVSEHDAPEGAAGAKPERTTYTTTPDGDQEFIRLLSDALWHTGSDPSYVLAGLCFMTALPRDEVIDALTAREREVEARILGVAHERRRLEEQRLAPAFTGELLAVVSARLEGELAWHRQVRERLVEGWYRFAGEPGWPDLPAEDGTWVPAILGSR